MPFLSASALARRETFLAVEDFLPAASPFFPDNVSASLELALLGLDGLAAGFAAGFAAGLVVVRCCLRFAALSAAAFCSARSLARMARERVLVPGSTLGLRGLLLGL